MKGAGESDLDVGDKANDNRSHRWRRPDAARWWGRAQTSASPRRAESSSPLGGGRIDTDAIDNSAGVDTSDHEVNIKILTGLAIRAERPEGGRPRPAVGVDDG